MFPHQGVLDLGPNLRPCRGMGQGSGLAQVRAPPIVAHGPQPTGPGLQPPVPTAQVRERTKASGLCWLVGDRGPLHPCPGGAGIAHSAPVPLTEAAANATDVLLCYSCLGLTPESCSGENMDVVPCPPNFPRCAIGMASATIGMEPCSRQPGWLGS